MSRMTVTPQDLALLQRMPTAQPPRPRARGPVSAFLLEHLARPVHPLPAGPALVDDPLDGDDAALALYCCYELHYRGFDGVDEDWEWEPTLLGFRREIEGAFLERVQQIAGAVPDTTDVVTALLELLAEGAAPSLSRYVADKSTLEQLLEFHVHRSAYQLKAADPHRSEERRVVYERRSG